MKKEILIALVEKWRRVVESDNTRDGSENAKVENAKLDGINVGIKRCGNDLIQLVKLLGD